MSLLPASELDAIRSEAELALPDTCTIQVMTATNTKGSVALTYANTYTNVACRLAPANRVAAEKEIGAELAEASDYLLTVAHDQAIEPSSRVVHSGVTYEVAACANATASWRTVRRVYLKLVE